jgi:thiol-disulfide isomerase/thioredoxin
MAALGLTLVAGRRDAARDAAGPSRPGALELSSAAVVPPATFARLDGGGSGGGGGSLADYRGRPLVVNFFAAWCFPCLAELPGFERVHQTVGDRVAFVGLNLQDRAEDGRAVVARTGITYDVGRDPDGDLFRAFGAVTMPTTAFVDAEGRVVEVYGGELTAEALRAKIEDLLL